MASSTDSKTGQPIFGYYEPGFNHVGSYQTSCRPFATASLVVPASGSDTYTKITFPGVTKFVVVRNDELGDSFTSSDIRLSFASGGLNDPNANYIILKPSSSFSADFRITQLYLMSDSSTATSASVIAGITTINAARVPSGSWEDTVGVDKQ
tara:strand:- start:38 stop:493 length:456 start_codon:yes stop_codon:yes gene_type:complete